MTFRRVIALLSIVPLAVLAYTKLVPEGQFRTPGTALPAPVREVGGGAPADAAYSGGTPAGAVAALRVVAEGLEVPWDIAFLPDGGMLVTERRGRLVRLAPDGTRTSLTVPGVAPRGEGGLLGMVLHPAFSENRLLYLYQTRKGARGWENRVVQYRLEGDTLTEMAVLVEGIPAARYHDGGRMAWGPDGTLYITTGDAGDPPSAQDLTSLAGKILRINEDGTVPSDNPFPGSPVYSYGHRNPQGLAWDTEGRLWSTEHGPSGPLACCRDELNRIVPGGNYGWPAITGAEVREGMRTPVLQSGDNITWAPASLAFWRGRLWFGGLRGESLYEVQSATTTPRLYQHLRGVLGRIRTVKVGPDGALYLLTSNRDGRGRPRAGDDKLLRWAPAEDLTHAP